ncbi:hypothetical protein BDA96_05G124900 [Sorghum bicolor]|uniref:Uncharacterized protein n=2 Tax=Sorghum bicolor TaxID=4558 RepID=A0A921UF60_SORBI|nr:hypothetical protein BDA96_05G124900 [Sorghum bicolor]OQU83429.1 hypothetical protein SORBI_3005G113533 [Sorghum bicolor]
MEEPRTRRPRRSVTRSASRCAPRWRPVLLFPAHIAIVPCFAAALRRPCLAGANPAPLARQTHGSRSRSKLVLLLFSLLVPLSVICRDSSTKPSSQRAYSR